MARHSIVEKLEHFLRQRKGIRTEAEVVYVLVELRKLLEHDNTKAKSPVLNFYCNWVVHTKLESSPIADRIIRLMDNLHAYMVSKTNTAISIDDLRALLDQSSLRKELGALLSRCGLPTTFCDDDTNWNRFQRALGAVIQDAPLFVQRDKKQKTRFIESVAFRNKPLEHGLSLNFEWKIEFHTNPEGKMRLHPELVVITPKPHATTRVAKMHRREQGKAKR